MWCPRAVGARSVITAPLTAHGCALSRPLPTRACARVQGVRRTRGDAGCVRPAFWRSRRWGASGVLIDNDSDEIATRFLSDAGKDGQRLTVHSPPQQKAVCVIKSFFLYPGNVAFRLSRLRPRRLTRPSKALLPHTLLFSAQLDNCAAWRSPWLRCRWSAPPSCPARPRPGRHGSQGRCGVCWTPCSMSSTPTLPPSTAATSQTARSPPSCLPRRRRSTARCPWTRPRRRAGRPPASCSARGRRRA